jgi:hypothetical protein
MFNLLHLEKMSLKFFLGKVFFVCLIHVQNVIIEDNFVPMDSIFSYFVSY